MESTRVVKSLAALAHPVRLEIFRALVVAGPKGVTPGAMQEALGIPATSLSFHFKELAGSELVHAERAGRNLIYRAAYENMNALIGYLTDNCCEGAGCAVALHVERPRRLPRKQGRGEG